VFTNAYITHTRHAHAFIYMQIYIYKQPKTHSYTKHIPIHIQTHRDMHTHINAHTHIHTQSQRLQDLQGLLSGFIKLKFFLKKGQIDKHTKDTHRHIDTQTSTRNEDNLFHLS
jgi:hypothetical protein